MSTVECKERRPLNFRVCSVFCNAVEYRVIFVHGVERGVHSNCQLYYRDDTGDMRTREHAVAWKLWHTKYSWCSVGSLLIMTVNSGLWESLIVLVLLQKWIKTRISRAHKNQLWVRSVVVADQTDVQRRQRTFLIGSRSRVRFSRTQPACLECRLWICTLTHSSTVPRTSFEAWAPTPSRTASKPRTRRSRQHCDTCPMRLLQ